MDPFDGIFEPVPTNTRAGGKFQAKLKHIPRKATLASDPPLVPCGVSKRASSTSFGETGTGVSENKCEDCVSDVLEDLKSERSPAEVAGIREEDLQDTLDDNSGSKVLGDPDMVDKGNLIDSTCELASSNVTLTDEHKVIASSPLSNPADVEENLDTVPNTGLDAKVSTQTKDLGKSAAENADIFSELEFLDDFIPQSTADTKNEESEPQSKHDIDDKHEEKLLTSDNTEPALGNTILPSETHSLEDFTAQAHCSIDSSEFMCDVVPQTGSEYEEFPVDNQRSEIEAAETFFDFDTLDSTFVSGQRGGKFKPRPNLRKGKDKVSSYDHHAEVVSSLPSEDVGHLDSSNNECIYEVPISDLPREDGLDCSSVPEIQMNEEPTCFTEAVYSHGSTFGGMLSEDDPGNLGGQTGPVENFTDLNNQRKKKASRQLRKRLRQILDESVEEAEAVGDPMYEPPTTSHGDEDEDNDECNVNDTSKKRKSKKSVEESITGNDNIIRKGKRAKKASEESSNEPPRKKFSHSSRRNKRKVDKALLDTPEDEIDTQRLPIRDLILLAEHRERMMMKDTAKQKTPQANQSNDDSFRGDAYRDEEMFSPEQGQYSDEDQPHERVQPTAVYVNYHTYMDKKPGFRWSKLETELFYQAVRQFGTDFTMIQKLFPNRTRGQVKSKFKREELQHPLRLSEAAMNRAKDNTHFEFVIEQLQQDAAAKQESCGFDSAAISGEEEADDDANDVVTKPEQNDESVDKQEADVVENQKSPLKSDKSEDEYEDDDNLDRWNQYNY